MGRIIRLKARLIARGFNQIYGIDYLDTYVPVVKLVFIKILLAIAAIFNLEMHQMNIVMAFLVEKLKKKIYMKQSEGYKDDKDMVYRLIKSLYELKQVPRV